MSLKCECAWLCSFSPWFWQNAVAFFVVVSMAALGGGRHPWWADMAIYVPTWLMVMTLSDKPIQDLRDRHNSKARSAE